MRGEREQGAAVRAVVTSPAWIPRALGLAVLVLATTAAAEGSDPARAADPSAVPAVERTPAAAVWIRPEEVAVRADGLSRGLEVALPAPAMRAEVEHIDRELAALAPEVEALVQHARAATTRITPFIELDDLWRELVVVDRRLAVWEVALVAEAKRIAEVLDETAQARELWLATRARAETAAAGAAVARRVEGSLTALEEAATALQPWRVQLLAVSDRVLDRRAALAGATKRVETAAATEWTNILVPGRPPLWRGGFAERLAYDLPRVPAQLVAYNRAIWAYVVRDPRPLVVQIVVGLALILVLRRFAGRAGAAATMRPGALAALLTLFATPWLHPLAPQGFRQLSALLALAPAASILRAAPGVVDAIDIGGLLLLLLVDRVVTALAPLPAAAQVTVLAAYALAIGLLVRLIRHGQRSGRRRLVGIARAAFVGLVVAAAAALGGWDQLSALVGRGILAGAAVAVYLSAAALGLEPFVLALLATPTMQRRHLFVDDPVVRRRRLGYVLTALAVVLWLVYVLRAVGMLGAATAGVQAVLAAGVTVGALSISIGTVLAFVATLLAAMLIARTVTGVLEEDVYPRASLPRGVPIVLSTLVRYLVYSLGFLLALAAAGIQLSQLAILLGGLGVGIGLGLQDLVKNFAAGLTLLFERRVHPGDVVQIPNAQIFGRVLSIGMRATVVRAWNGSEIVVPNADMVASTITNWTLSDRLCRLEVPVGVAYGTDPERVIALLLDAVHADPRLLADPAPQAIFKGFGESSLDFVVRAWTDKGIEEMVRMTSDLAVAVNRAFADAGIVIPFPQRDLHLASVAPSVGAALASREEKA